jgi:hypothetical protein
MKFENGKIYKLTSKSIDDVYIGSTTLNLSQRMAIHRHCYKMYLNHKFCCMSSYGLISRGDCIVELIEKYPCKSRDELETRERYYVENTDHCVNKNMPHRNHKESMKHYCQTHKKEIKQYYESHKDEIGKQKKQYYQLNKQKILTYMKKYYEKNKNKKLKYQKNYYEQKKKN